MVGNKFVRCLFVHKFVLLVLKQVISADKMSSHIWALPLSLFDFVGGRACNQKACIRLATILFRGR